VTRMRPWFARVCAMSVLALVCTGISLGPGVSATSSLPNPVLNVVATPSTTSTVVVVTWQFPTTGVTPDRAMVAAWQGKTLAGTVTCAYPICTSENIPGLVPGEAYRFDVFSGTAAGYSAATTSATVTVNWGCSTANVCLTANATTPGGPVLHNAAGMDQGVTPVTPAALIAPLGIKYWETGAGPPICGGTSCTNYSSFDAIRADDPTASISEVLSDNWYAETYEAYRDCPNMTMCDIENAPKPWGGAEMPWANWSQFDSFTQSVVKTVEASGRTVALWNLINEPPSQGAQNDAYFDGAQSPTLTASDIEQWLLHAYNDVRAADPSAQIVCPSFEQYDDFPGETPAVGQLLDFSTFLAFAAANNMDCNAFAWHEINYEGSLTDFNMQPQTMLDHIARFKALLQSYPQFAGTPIIINEYAPNVSLEGGQLYETMPGWIVGYIASLEASGVEEANHTCVTGGCNDLADDTLVVSGSTITTSDTYWPYVYYAQMSGNSIPITSSQEQINGFGSLNTSTNTIMMLLGRHDVEGVDALPANETTTLTVDIPSSWNTPSVTVSSDSFIDSGGADAGPTPVVTTVPVVNGVATITIAAFGGQNAYGITVTPTA
jgi:hypothetical protein